jgi:4-amino-4-deoxy-L-arabinose transferase-like glycosyltransferase
MSMIEQPRSETAEPAVFWVIALFIFCVWVLLSNLAGTALFEPDEGRNAEIAREILLLKDWVTPHYDFIPRLDKPILFFDLVALSYKVFGISEWSARLPSALAALGCLFLTYWFSRTSRGRAVALWSTLILLTSVEFFVLSQIVILDMLLTFFLTLALCCFFVGHSQIDRGKGRAQFLVMYAAIGAATVTKGPIGFLLPAAIMFVYILLTRQWVILRHMELPFGIPLFLISATSWYLMAEWRNPGFVHHFLWEENFSRFATTRFNRVQPWYFYIVTLPAGFFPWSIFLPSAITDFWKHSVSRERLFLIVWISLPLLFFSLSTSKLLHYILPIFPPLAMIVGETVARAFQSLQTKRIGLAAFPFISFLLLSLTLAVVLIWPGVLPDPLKQKIAFGSSQVPILPIAGLFVLLLLAVAAIRTRLWRNPAVLYAATAATFALFLQLSQPIAAAVADYRSSRLLAEKSAAYISASDQLALYGGYPSSLPYYLKIHRPIWVAWSGRKRQVLGSDYVALQRPNPAVGYGQVLYTYDEFAELWKTSDRRMLVFVDSGAVNRFKELVETPVRVLSDFGDFVLFENRGAEHSRTRDD